MNFLSVVRFVSLYVACIDLLNIYLTSRAGMSAGSDTNKQTGRETGRQAGRQADRRADIQRWRGRKTNREIGQERWKTTVCTSCL
jgi:hypothetical protein